MNTDGHPYARNAFRLIGWYSQPAAVPAIAVKVEPESLFHIVIHQEEGDYATMVRLTSSQAESLAKRLASKGAKFSIESIEERDREGLMRWLNDCGLLIQWDKLPS